MTILKNFLDFKKNAEKTQIFPINCPDNLEPDTTHLGFKTVSTMTILGYHVSNCQDMSEINFNCVLQKIRNQIQTWSKFKLSLPGRIKIAKTVLLSQIGYFSSLIHFNGNMRSSLRLEMGNYIKFKLKISIHKATLNITLKASE